MKLGVVFPQTEIGADPGGVAAFGRAAEALGYDHIAAFDHVIGANPASRPGFDGPYTCESMFHEPMVLFAYLAGLTGRIGFATGILIVPQRQTVLVAKQAAALDVLSGGRLRLGIGIGWNRVEFEALGESFADRGRRCEEQVAVLRALWSRNPISFEGRWHRIDDAGLHPLPVQRPIPIWFGGMAEPVIARAGRIGDGWFPLFPGLGLRADSSAVPRRGDAPAAIVARLRDYARAAGRDPAAIGIEGRLSHRGAGPEDWRAERDAWRALGASHLQVSTMGAGFDGPDAHIAAIAAMKEALDGG